MDYSIAKYQPKTCLEIRREMATVPAVLDALTPVERAVFIASTAKTFTEYETKELATELGKALRYIAKDTGYRNTDESEMGYLVARACELVKRYYGGLTIKDFRIAFEMSITGELDEFLPKNKDGQADRGHYQQFNAEYICKILNAYIRKRGNVLKKAEASAPKKERPRDPEQEKYIRNYTRQECISAFYHYKYRGRLMSLTSVGEMLCYNTLSEVGLAEDVVITDDELQEILRRTIAAFSGNRIEVNRLKHEGTKAKELQYGANILARRKAIRQTFDWMIEREIQITDYIKFEL